MPARHPPPPTPLRGAVPAAAWRAWIAALCLAFLVLQAAYVTRLPLVMDEFQGAATVHRLADGLPYRDFRPYKTVLGYYLQLPVLLAAERPWAALIAVKLEMAVLVALTLAAAALALGRIFDRRAVVLGLGLLLVMSTFAERSAELRVDMLTALAGLVSLVLLLHGRAGWAGAAAGVSFLLSQKGLYFVLAGNAALGAVWLLVDRGRRRTISWLAFNGAAAGLLAVYVGAWSLVSSPPDVLRATFLSHGDIALRQLYDNRLKYWSQTLRRNPLFYGLALAGLYRLLRGRPGSLGQERRLALAAYGGVLAALAVAHRQPWPYFFVLLIPTLWVLVVALLDAELETWREHPPAARRALLAALVALGFLWPATRVAVVAGRSNAYQRSMVELADRILDSGGSYLAGTELIFDRPQSERRLAWLDIPRNRALAELPVHEIEGIRRDLARHPPKLVVNNYRIYGLPRPLRAHLGRTYEPWWGSIAIYSPSVDGGATEVEIAFDGIYELAGSAGAALEVGGRSVVSGDRVELAAGRHAVAGGHPFRLRYVPAGVEDRLDPRFQRSQLFFPDVYVY
jgi:hypothetical protein